MSPETLRKLEKALGCDECVAYVKSDPVDFLARSITDAMIVGTTPPVAVKLRMNAYHDFGHPQPATANGTPGQTVAPGRTMS